eukprot:scaffold103723_cov63-Phaeocystis_antarctica.AAC.4
MVTLSDATLRSTLKEFSMYGTSDVELPMQPLTTAHRASEDSATPSLSLSKPNVMPEEPEGSFMSLNGALE